MSVHLQRDIEQIHQQLLAMGGRVEEMIYAAVETLTEPSIDAALQLAKDDTDIDALDVEIEEQCLKALALHQPFAVDLRRIATVLKISAELERVADIGVHIAERTAAFERESDPFVPNKLKRMAKMAVLMLHESIDAYVQLDVDLALGVCAKDDEVDAANVEIIEDVKRLMAESPERIDPLLQLFSISRHLERVADHATNIAEGVVYLETGKIIRHQSTLEQESLLPSDEQAD